MTLDPDRVEVDRPKTPALSYPVQIKLYQGFCSFAHAVFNGCTLTVRTAWNLLPVWAFITVVLFHCVLVLKKQGR